MVAGESTGFWSGGLGGVSGGEGEGRGEGGGGESFYGDEEGVGGEGWGVYWEGGWEAVMAVVEGEGERGRWSGSFFCGVFFMCFASRNDITNTPLLS